MDTGYCRGTQFDSHHYRPPSTPDRGPGPQMDPAALHDRWGLMWSRTVELQLLYSLQVYISNKLSFITEK